MIRPLLNTIFCDETNFVASGGTGPPLNPILYLRMAVQNDSATGSFGT